MKPSPGQFVISFTLLYAAFEEELHISTAPAAVPGGANSGLSQNLGRIFSSANLHDWH
jgi:hypothetical protein